MMIFGSQSITPANEYRRRSRNKMTCARVCSSVRASPDPWTAELSQDQQRRNLMISREELRRLAQLESPEGSAISFYFQPQTPQDKSHREEAILVKDLVRDALRKAERNGNDAAMRQDLEKVLEIAEGLHGNHSRGKAIFACREQGIWHEFDVPPRLGRSQITVNSRFHLRPLVDAKSGLPRTCI